MQSQVDIQGRPRRYQQTFVRPLSWVTAVHMLTNSLLHSTALQGHLVNGSKGQRLSSAFDRSEESKAPSRLADCIPFELNLDADSLTRAVTRRRGQTFDPSRIETIADLHD